MAKEYKLKDLASLNLKPGEKREVEVEGVEGGKVLLCNVGGKTTAIGNKCTHYGAPLVKGVLTGDGRITCPWHGGMSSRSPFFISSWLERRCANCFLFGTACFKAGNGDVENAPAIDALPSYNIEEKNGAVYITGDAETIKSSRRKPNIRISGVAGQEKVVIVGHGSGGNATLEALREGGYRGSITVIGRYVVDSIFLSMDFQYYFYCESSIENVLTPIPIARGTYQSTERSSPKL